MALKRTHAQLQDQADFVSWAVEVGRLGERFLGMSYEQMEEDHCANDFYGEGMKPTEFVRDIVMENILADFPRGSLYEVLFENLYYR